MPQQHRLQLPDGQVVAWQLLRSARRSIGLTVTARGLVVRAPQRLALADIARAVQGKATWVARARQRVQAQAPAGAIHWAQGGALDYLGQSVQLHMQPDGAAPGLHAGRLHLPLAQDAAPDVVRACVQGWMMHQARAWFAMRLAHFAPLIGVQHQKLRLSSARTRWGSASSSGTISLHWRLMQHAAPVIDYVVVHELAHLRHMNHSAQFWAVVASVLPGYAAQRQALRHQRLPAW